MKKLHLQALPVLAISMFAIACGRFPGDWPEDFFNPVVIKATDEDIKLGRALENSYIVTFKTGSDETGVHFPNFSAEYAAHFRSLSGHMNDRRVKNLHFLTSIDLNHPETVAEEPSFNVQNGLKFAWENDGLTLPAKVGAITRVDFSSRAAAESLLDEWEKLGLIWFAEPNYMSEPGGVWDGKKQTYEAEVSMDRAYWLQKIQVMQAYGALVGMPGSSDDEPVIAVLDSGVDIEHPGLKTRIFKNPFQGELGCGGDDEWGCNTTNPKKGVLGNGEIWPWSLDGHGKPCSEAKCSHGTHVSGIIAGYPPQEGVAGVCPTCRIMVLRIVSSNQQTGKKSADPTILDSSIIGAFKYVSSFERANLGGLLVRVVNASFGKFQRSRPVAVLVRALKKASPGALVIAAAGNEDTNKYQYPAAYPDAIAVSNVTNNGVKHITSNWGRWVDIAAPGHLIYATIPGGGTEDKEGTSMAAPIVAGVAGLVVAGHRGIGFNDLRAAVLNGSDPNALYDVEINQHYAPAIPGQDTPIPLLGSGLVNAYNSVRLHNPGGHMAVVALDQVTGSCAVINGLGLEGFGLLLSLLLAIPVFVAFRNAYRS